MEPKTERQEYNGKNKSTYTPAQAAKLASAGVRTICNWFDAGLIKGYRLPKRDGTPGHRRLFQESFSEFLTLQGMDNLAKLPRLEDKKMQELKKYCRMLIDWNQGVIAGDETVGFAAEQVAKYLLGQLDGK